MSNFLQVRNNSGPDTAGDGAESGVGEVALPVPAGAPWCAVPPLPGDELAAPCAGSAACGVTARSCANQGPSPRLRLLLSMLKLVYPGDNKCNKRKII